MVAKDEEIIELALNTANRNVSKNHIVRWFRKHVEKLEEPETRKT